MSREILFRGLAGGELVYGSYISQMLPSGKFYEAIQCEIDGAIREVVIAAGTVGQYTGLKDCNGVKIFEGDIVRSYHFTDSRRRVHYLKHIVTWSEKFSAWFLLNASSMDEADGSIMIYQRFNKYNYEVVGNTHQHPQLLEAK